MFKRIEYVSMATDELDDRALERLLEGSRVNNKRVGVTGALMKAGRVFYQILEGEPNHVAAVYRRILADPRHETIQLLRSVTAEERMFPEWSMRLYDPSTLGVRDGVTVRTLMQRLDMMQRSMAELSNELALSAATYFAPKR